MAVDDIYTKSLLHFAGTDESQIFSDQSGKIWTATGGAKIDTAQYKFGGSSGLFDGGTGLIYTTGAADLYWVDNVAATIDFWCMFSTLPANDSDFTFLCCSAQYGVFESWYFGLYYVSASTFRLEFLAKVGTTMAIRTTTTIPLATNEWNHYALIKTSGNIFQTYFKGVKTGSSATITGITQDARYTIGGNRGTGNNTVAGWIDEYRHSVGIARWTNDFTPRQVPYGTQERSCYLHSRIRDRFNIKGISTQNSLE